MLIERQKVARHAFCASKPISVASTAYHFVHLPKAPFKSNFALQEELKRKESGGLAPNFKNAVKPGAKK